MPLSSPVWACTFLLCSLLLNGNARGQESPCYLCPGGRYYWPVNPTAQVQLDAQGLPVNFTCSQLANLDDLSQTLFVKESGTCESFQQEMLEVCGCPPGETAPPTPLLCTVCAEGGKLRPGGIVSTPAGNFTCQYLSEQGDITDFVTDNFDQTCSEFQASVIDTCACKRDCGTICSDGSVPNNLDGTIGSVIGTYSCLQLYALGILNDATFAVGICSGDIAVSICGCPAEEPVPTSVPIKDPLDDGAEDSDEPVPPTSDGGESSNLFCNAHGGGGTLTCSDGTQFAIGEDGSGILVNIDSSSEEEKITIDGSSEEEKKKEKIALDSSGEEEKMKEKKKKKKEKKGKEDARKLESSA